MVFSTRNSSKSFFLFFIFYILYFFLYAIFIPTFENPDEVLHYQHVLETKELIVNILGDGNLYYFLTHRFYNFFNELFSFNVNINFIHNSNFNFFNDNFRFLHNNTDEPYSLILMRVTNLLYILIFYTIYYLFFRNILNNLLFYSLLLFPGIISFSTAVNPDNLNILIAFLISLMLFKKKYFYSLIIMLFCFTLIDRSIIIFFGSLLFYLVILFFNKKIFTIIIYTLSFTILFSSLNYVKEILYGIHTDYEPIKSIFTLIVSYYGLLGSMSIKASYLEYFFFFIIMFFYIKHIVIKNFFRKEELYKIVHFIIIYFVIWNFILSIGTSLDQGRFFYPLHFILIFTIINQYKDYILFKYNNIIYWMLLLGFIINIKFIIKIILLGDII